MSTPPGDQPHDSNQPPRWDPNQGQGSHEQGGYGQGGYEQGGYGQGGYGASYPAAPPPQGSWAQQTEDHPRAMLSLILGIIGLLCLPVTAPFAWVIGKGAIGEIDASGGRLRGRGMAQAGYILGIVGTVILVLSILAVILLVVVGGVAFEANVR